MLAATMDVSQGPVAEALERFGGRRVFFEKLQGNNGDRLIELGSVRALEQSGAQIVDSPHQADAIIMNGGAGLTDIWKHGFETLRRYNTRHADTPLIVLPSSVLFEKSDFASLFVGRRAPAVLYARERVSHDMLSGLRYPSEVSIGIDHDMAFHLADSELVNRLRVRVSQKHILVVERRDSESVSGPYRIDQPRGIKRLLPRTLKRAVRKHLINPMFARRHAGERLKSNQATAFATESLGIVRRDY